MALIRTPRAASPGAATPAPAANADTVSGVGAGSAQALTVYGRPPPQTTPSQGACATALLTLT